MRTGESADRAAASCWEIKQLHPTSPDGAYWLLTPAMTAPERFWCDMTTDGGGWVRVGAARHQWFASAEGRGDPAGLLVANPAPTVTLQLPATTIDALMNDGAVNALPNGIRVRRALDAAGTSWQEVRFTMPKQTGWQWAFGAAHPVGTWSVGSSSGTGGNSYSFGTGQLTSRVDTSVQQSQNYTWGFAYGTSISGTSDVSTYLWGAAGSTGRARPYAEVYIRPRLTSSDSLFSRLGMLGLLR